jgi:hypothetical protein
MVADPFFCLKIDSLKATVHRDTSISVKTGSSDSADNATTRLLFPDWNPIGQSVTISISQLSQRDVPMHLMPSRFKIRRIWRTVFILMDALTVRTVALRQAIFKLEKGFITISLSLIYHAMVLSQPPSRDAVPLKLYYSTY